MQPKVKTDGCFRTKVVPAGHSHNLATPCALCRSKDASLLSKDNQKVGCALHNCGTDSAKDLFYACK
jgi:hypothetical protein